MANYKVTDTELTSIANAIRTKGGTQAQLTFPQGFIDAINAISGGGGGGGGGGVNIVSWASGSDADVAAMIDAAHAGTIDLQQDGGWAVGDVRTIHLSAFTGGNNTKHQEQDAEIVLTSFADYMSSGNVLQFDFKHSLKLKQSLMAVDGYGASTMATVTLPAMANALPEWLRERLITFSVLVGAGNNSHVIETVTGNKLALRSEIEIFGSVTKSDPGEGSQITYYAAPENRIKRLGGPGYFVAEWWERSAVATSTSYCYVGENGDARYESSGYSYGLSPFGCL